MDTKELIDMLNRDFADEHAAIIRYLVHAYQEGEDTPLIGVDQIAENRGVFICKITIQHVDQFLRIHEIILLIK